MTTVTVPISSKEEKALKNLISWGFASNKAEIMRKALLGAEEEAHIAIVLESQQCVKENKLLRGNPKELIKKIEK